MIEQESSGTHWQNRRITISFRGALGFLQIQPFNSLAYNNLGNIPANTNLYAPDGNLLAGAQYMNDPCLSRSYVTEENAVEGDDNVDLLAKSLAGYNGGPYHRELNNYNWQQVIARNENGEVGCMRDESIRYALQIKQRLNLQLKSWEEEWLNSH